jgi:hypothetical protein
MRPIYQPQVGVEQDSVTHAFNNSMQSVIAATAELQEHLDLADTLLSLGRSEELDIAIEALASRETALLDAARRLLAADAALSAKRASRGRPLSTSP